MFRLRTGQGLVEYVLILLLVVIVVVTAFAALGRRTSEHVGNASNMMGNAGD